MNSKLIKFRQLTSEGVASMWPELEALSADQAWMSWGQEGYLKALPRKWEVSRAAYMDDVLVGYCLGSVRAGVLWIHRLVVDKNARGAGVGAAILDEMSQVAAGIELSAVILKTPLDNTQAIGFYQAHGFRQVASNNGYLTLMNQIAPGLKVGIHQPNYLPWLGYFYKMAISDIFIFLDDAEFPKGSYVNRNKVAVNGDAKWLTVPTGRGYQTAIMDAFPSGEEWVDKHLRLLESAYRTAPYFREYFDDIGQVLRANAARNFADLNIALIEHVAARIGVECVCLRASQMNVAGRSDARLAELVSAVGGSVYVSGSGGANYQSEATFSEKAIHLEYAGFAPEAYPQVGPGFIPGLGVLDALFNVGEHHIRQVFKAMKAARPG